MSSVHDFGPIYATTGTIAQIDYAMKCANLGSTIIALKSSQGIVIAVEKPRESKLIANKKNKRIQKLSSGIFMTYTGLLSDGIYIFDSVKRNILDHLDTFEDSPTPHILKGYISSVVSIFTRYFSTRPVGCHFITGTVDNGEYKLLVTDCYSKTRFVKAYAIGKGANRANSELEKLDMCDASLEQMADHAVRLLYKSYDPLRDLPFDIELVYMDVSSRYNIAEYGEDFTNSLIEKYQDFSVDGE